MSGPSGSEDDAESLPPSPPRMASMSADAILRPPWADGSTRWT